MEEEYIKKGELRKPTLRLHWNERADRTVILRALDRLYTQLEQCEYSDGPYNASVYNLIRLYLRNTVFDVDRNIDVCIRDLAAWVNIEWRYA
jgi:hypothetical protein